MSYQVNRGYPKNLKNDFNSPSISERRNGYAVHTLHLRPEGRGFTAQVDKFGGTGEVRTHDRRIKSPLLYRLSYDSITVIITE